MSRILEILRNEFEYVVVDTPPAFDDQVLAAFDVSDVIALVVTPDVPSLKNLRITLATLSELDYRPDTFRLVLNRADARVGVSHAEVVAAAELKLSAQIPSSRDVPASINRGVALVQVDPGHAVSQAIRAFGEQNVLARPVFPGGSPSRRRLFRRHPPAS